MVVSNRTKRTSFVCRRQLLLRMEDQSISEEEGKRDTVDDRDRTNSILFQSYILRSQ